MARLLVFDDTSDDIFEINPDGEDTEGTRLRGLPSTLVQPAAAAVLNGRLLVFDNIGDELYEINPDGEDTEGTKLRDLPSTLTAPLAAAVLNGRLLVFDDTGDEIFEINPDGEDTEGTRLRGLPSTLTRPFAAAVLNGRLLVFDFDGDEIFEINPDGEDTEGTKLRDLPSTLTAPRAAAVLNGRLLVFDNTGDEIFEINPDGEDTEGTKLRDLPSTLTTPLAAAVVLEIEDIDLSVSIAAGGATLSSPRLSLSAVPIPPAVSDFAVPSGRRTIVLAVLTANVSGNELTDSPATAAAGADLAVASDLTIDHIERYGSTIRLRKTGASFFSSYFNTGQVYGDALVHVQTAADGAAQYDKENQGGAFSNWSLGTGEDADVLTNITTGTDFIFAITVPVEHINLSIGTAFTSGAATLSSPTVSLSAVPQPILIVVGNFTSGAATLSSPTVSLSAVPQPILIVVGNFTSGAATLSSPTVSLSAVPQPILIVVGNFTSGAASFPSPTIVVIDTLLDLSVSIAAGDATLSSPRLSLTRVSSPTSLSVASFNAGDAGFPSPTIVVIDAFLDLSVSIAAGGATLSSPRLSLTRVPNPTSLSVASFNAGNATLSSPALRVFTPPPSTTATVPVKNNELIRASITVGDNSNGIWYSRRGSQNIGEVVGSLALSSTITIDRIWPRRAANLDSNFQLNTAGDNISAWVWGSGALNNNGGIESSNLLSIFPPHGDGFGKSVYLAFGDTNNPTLVELPFSYVGVGGGGFYNIQSRTHDDAIDAVASGTVVNFVVADSSTFALANFDSGGLEVDCLALIDKLTTSANLFYTGDNLIEGELGIGPNNVSIAIARYGSSSFDIQLSTGTFNLDTYFQDGKSRIYIQRQHRGIEFIQIAGYSVSGTTLSIPFANTPFKSFVQNIAPRERFIFAIAKTNHINLSIGTAFTSGAVTLSSPTVSLTAVPQPILIVVGNFTSGAASLSSPTVTVFDSIVDVEVPPFTAGDAGFPSPTIVVIDPSLDLSVSIAAGGATISSPILSLTRVPSPTLLSVALFNAGNATLSSPRVVVEEVPPNILTVGAIRAGAATLPTPTLTTTFFSLFNDLEVEPIKTPPPTLSFPTLQISHLYKSPRRVISKSVGFLRGIVYEGQARRHVAYLLRRAQRPASVTVTVPYSIGKGFKIWDTIELNFTRVSGKFKISTYPAIDTQQGTVSFTALEDQDIIYTDSVQTAIGLREITGTDVFVDPPVNLRADSDAIVQSDGSVIVQTNVEWNEPPKNVVRIVVQHRRQPSTAWHTSWDGDPFYPVIIADTPAGSVIDIRARFYDEKERPSVWTQITHNVVGDLQPPGKITNLTVEGGVRQLIVTWTPPADNDYSHSAVKVGTAALNAANASLENKWANFVDKGIGQSSLVIPSAADEEAFVIARPYDYSGNAGLISPVVSATPVGLDIGTPTITTDIVYRITNSGTPPTAPLGEPPFPLWSSTYPTRVRPVENIWSAVRQRLTLNGATVSSGVWVVQIASAGTTVVGDEVADANQEVFTSQTSRPASPADEPASWGSVLAGKEGITGPSHTDTNGVTWTTSKQADSTWKASRTATVTTQYVEESRALETVSHTSWIISEIIVEIFSVTGLDSSPYTQPFGTPDFDIPFTVFPANAGLMVSGDGSPTIPGSISVSHRLQLTATTPGTFNVVVVATHRDGRTITKNVRLIYQSAVIQPSGTISLSGFDTTIRIPTGAESVNDSFTVSPSDTSITVERTSGDNVSTVSFDDNTGSSRRLEYSRRGQTSGSDIYTFTFTKEDFTTRTEDVEVVVVEQAVLEITTIPTSGSITLSESDSSVTFGVSVSPNNVSMSLTRVSSGTRLLTGRISDNSGTNRFVSFTRRSSSSNGDETWRLTFSKSGYPDVTVDIDVSVSAGSPAPTIRSLNTSPTISRAIAFPPQEITFVDSITVSPSSAAISILRTSGSFNINPSVSGSGATRAITWLGTPGEFTAHTITAVFDVTVSRNSQTRTYEVTVTFEWT